MIGVAVRALVRRCTARSVVVIGVATCGALLGATACTGGDDAVPVTDPTTTAVSTTTAVTTTTEVPVPESVVGDRVSSIEVSARLLDGDAETVWAISVGQATLDTVEAVGADQSAAWCSGISDAGGATRHLVRIGPPAVDAATGGVERFEIVASQNVVGPGPVVAVLETVVDGRSLTARDAVLDLLDDRRSGTFRAVTAEGVLIEGAFRCT